MEDMKIFLSHKSASLAATEEQLAKIEETMNEEVQKIRSFYDEKMVLLDEKEQELICEARCLKEQIEDLNAMNE